MRSSASKRTAVISAMVALFLAWQILVPALMLFAQRPARFGWQMYSSLPDLPLVWRIDNQGREWPIEVTSVFAEPRAEIHYAAVLRAGVCDLPDTAKVKMVEPGHSTSELLDCE